MSTPIEENPPLFAHALQQGGNTHYTFRFFPGADHALHQSPDGGVTRLPSLAPGYAELVGSWSREVVSGRLPHADVPALPQQVCPDPPVQAPLWWGSAWLQLGVFALLLAALAAYPLLALGRRRHGGSLQPAVGFPARLLVGAGIATVLGFVVYMLYLLMTSGTRAAPGPVLAGRPLLWLLLQATSLVAIGAEVATVVAWRRAGSEVSRGEQLRLGLLLAGGALFVLWALSWGLLLP